MKSSRWFSLVDLLGIVLSLGLLFSRSDLLGDPGVGWHLKAGELMVSGGSLLGADPFLLWSGQPPEWIHDQWLSDVVFSLLYHTGGFALLHVLVLVLCVGSFVYVISPLQNKISVSAPVAFIFLLLAAVIASLQWFVRPVIFSEFLFALTYRFALTTLEEEKSTARRLLYWMPIFALWANLHAGFWLGLGLFWALVAELRLRGRMRSGASLGFLAGSLAMTLLNPWGYKLWLSTLALAADPYFTKLNQEWLPPGFSDPAFWPFLLSMILLALGLLGTRRSSLKRFDLMLLLPLLLLSLLHRRYLPFYAMLLPIPLTRMFPSHIFLRSLKAGDAPPVCTTILWGAMALSAILLGRLPMLEAHTSAFPPQLPSSELAEVLRSPGPVFHHPDIGGYIIWKGFPNLKAYIDDRNQLIGRERYEECFLVLRAEKGWEKILERWKIEWVLALRETPLIKTMETSEHWERRAYRPDSPWSLFHLKSNED